MAYRRVKQSNPLEYIYETKCGTLRELEDEVGESTVRQFEAMGFIKNAPSRNGDTWKISDKAKRLAEVMTRTYTRKARLRDFCHYKLPRMLFG